jgi:hypothetical protein
MSLCQGTAFSKLKARLLEAQRGGAVSVKRSRELRLAPAGRADKAVGFTKLKR